MINLRVHGPLPSTVMAALPANQAQSTIPITAQGRAQLQVS
jgi:hypothetical protein